MAIEESPIKPREANLVKQIITADKLICEPKGVDPFEVRNHLHLIISTNERFAVPAQHDERRYGVFPVSDAHKQDTAFFGELRKWFFEEGGAETVLHFLQTHDFGSVDLRASPRTNALLEQKVASLKLVDRVIFECLQVGEILPSREWGNPHPRNAVVETINDKRRKYEHEVTADAVGRRLHELFPASRDHRTSGKQRVWCWIIPPLPEARRDFERYLGQTIEWSNLDAEP